MTDTREVRRRLERRIADLPVLPTVIGQLMALDREDDAYFSRVLDLIEADPTYTARVIAAANSATSSPRSPITSVRMSLTRLGSRGASNLILAMAVSRVFVPRDDWERSLWRHSLQVAVAMRTLARHKGHGFGIDPDDAFTVGLLHDIGRFVLLAEAPDELRRIDEGNWDQPEQLIDLELEICGISHGEIGEIACSQWGLPQQVGQVVRRHHDADAKLSGDDVERMIALVHFADLAMFPSAMPGTPGYDSMDIDVIEAELLPKVPDGAAITAAELKEVIVMATAEVDEACIALGIA